MCSKQFITNRKMSRYYPLTREEISQVTKRLGLLEMIFPHIHQNWIESNNEKIERLMNEKALTAILKDIKNLKEKIFSRNGLWGYQLEIHNHLTQLLNPIFEENTLGQLAQLGFCPRWAQRRDYEFTVNDFIIEAKSYGIDYAEL